MNLRHRCWAEIDLNALRENLAWLRNRVGAQVKILTVVKADAYGHGLKQIAALLMQSGTDVFGVANLAEARAVRHVGQGWPILMLGACLPEEIESAVQDSVMPTISTVEEARRYSEIAKRLHKTVDVHAKVDTGMGRLGAPIRDAVAFIQGILQLDGLRLRGLYTHYASAEDDGGFTRLQRVRFQRLVKALRRDGLCPSLIHASNSAGILHEPHSDFGLVRPGLLVYGIVPQGSRGLQPALLLSRKGGFPTAHSIGGRKAAAPGSGTIGFRPALSWHCRVSLIKVVPTGASLSYGRTFVARKKMRVATLTAGYGDGYLRAGSNRAEVLIGGHRCRVLGRITMDQMLADVSLVSNGQSGDEAVLIGRQGEEQITAHDVAEWCGTVAWEVLTNISYRVLRIYRGAHAA